jgi:hypothetical protein
VGGGDLPKSVWDDKLQYGWVCCTQNRRANSQCRRQCPISLKLTFWNKCGHWPILANYVCWIMWKLMYIQILPIVFTSKCREVINIGRKTRIQFLGTCVFTMLALWSSLSCIPIKYRGPLRLWLPFKTYVPYRPKCQCLLSVPQFCSGEDDSDVARMINSHTPSKLSFM